MKKLLFTSVFTMMFAGAVLPQCSVVINEVNITPPPSAGSFGNSNSLYDDFKENGPQDDAEWIELYNPSPCESMDLSCYILASDMYDNTRTPSSEWPNWGAFAFPAGTIIPPLGHLVVGGNATPNVDFNLMQEASKGTPTFCHSKRWYLLSTDGYIALFDPTGTAIDMVYWSNTGAGGINSNNVFQNDRGPSCICNNINLPSAKKIRDSNPSIVKFVSPPSSIGATVARAFDGASIWVTNATATPGACNNGPSNCITPHTATVASKVDASCSAKGSATANTTTTGRPMTPFTYQWDDPAGQSSQTASNLDEGTYKVVVTDACGCKDSTTVTITKASGLDVTTDSTQASCGLANGSATVNVSGGTEPYKYQWDDTGNQTTATANGLAVGTYKVDIEDNTGCVSSAVVTVTGSASFTLSTDSTAAQCNTPNGTATATPAGGTGPFDYLWDDPAGQTTQTATGLTAGTYTVKVTDASGCEQSATITVPGQSALALNVSSTNVKCYDATDGTARVSISSGASPYTIEWTPSGGTDSIANGLAAGKYTVKVTDANGCSLQETVTISEPSEIKITTSSTVATCGQDDGSASASATGGTGNLQFQWLPGGEVTDSIGDIPAGEYMVVVTDASSCSDTATVFVESDSDLKVELGSTPVTCPGASDGSAWVKVQNGTEPFTYAWSNGNPNDSVAGLAVGTYTVVVIDNSRCSKMDSVKVGVDPNGPKASFNANPQKTTITQTTIDFENTSSGTTIWFWDFGDGGSSTEESPQHTFPSEPNTYPVKLITENSFGCIDSITKFVVIEAEIILYVPNAFTPNEDGKNDRFSASGDGFTDFNMYIYDRWGLLLYESDNINKGWDGRIEDGSSAPEDVYVYYIEVKDQDEHRQRFTGHFSLIR